MPRNLDLEAQRVVDMRQAAFVEGNLTAQQAIDPLILIAQVRAHPTDQRQVGLTAFDQRTRPYTSVMNELQMVFEGGLSPDHAAALFGRRGLNADDAIHQQEGRRRQADLPRELVLILEKRSEEVRHFPARRCLNRAALPGGTGRLSLPQRDAAIDDFLRRIVTFGDRKETRGDRRNPLARASATIIGHTQTRGRWKRRRRRTRWVFENMRHGIRHRSGCSPFAVRRDFIFLCCRQDVHNRLHVDCAPVCIEKRRCFGDLPKIGRLDPVNRDSSVGLALERRGETLCQRIPGTKFDECPDTVLPGAPHRLREVHRINGLSGQHVGH